MNSKKCVLLINLGSPERPEIGAIRKYLRAFLSDPRVMGMSGIFRWLILNLFILPFRPTSILSKYQKIWDGNRFPLVKYSEELVSMLSVKLGEEYVVMMAMRYSKPSIDELLKRIQAYSVSELLILPLFPQYASATSGSILEKVFETIRSWIVFPQIKVVSKFYDHPGFINAWTKIVKPYLEESPDHILFSFHGLPESHILKADKSNHCFNSDDCCESIGHENQRCYRAQCFQTAASIATSLNIQENEYSIGFQSRLGKGKWIGPSTAETIVQLAADGVRDLLVLCPAFVADCLETVEEIQVGENNRFLQSGGRKLTLVPSLNASPVWVNALSDLIKGKME